MGKPRHAITMGKKGVIVIVGVAALLIAALFTYILPQYYAPAYLVPKVMPPVIEYPNGTKVIGPALQFENGGLAVLMLPNGSQYVFNITNVEGFMELYRAMPSAFVKLNKSNALILIIPNTYRGWIKVGGITTSLTYYFSNYTVINGSSLEITYVLLNNQALHEINATNPGLAKYIPYTINLLIMRPSESGDQIIWTDEIEWVLKDLFGLVVARADQYVQYSTDCTGIYWATGWIDVGGWPGYTFYNEISIGGQTWSGWGALQAPQVSFSPPTSFVQVEETTSFYFGINENGYGISGQIASATTTWDLYPAYVYYTTSGTAILNAPSSAGSYNVCS